MTYEFRHINESELPAWFNHVAHVFQNTGREYFMNHWFQDPWAFLEGIRVAVQGDEIASTVRVFERQVYIGGAVVRMGGIGEVSTHEQHRNQGLSGQLLQDAIQLMSNRQYAVSVLFTGKHAHYQRHGWEIVPAVRWRYPNVVSNLHGAAAVSIRPVKYALDVESMANLYNQTASMLAGPVLRSPAYWWNWARRSLDNALIAERDGVPVAYMNSLHIQETVHIAEFAAAPGEKRALLALLKQTLINAGDGKVSIVVVPDALDAVVGPKLREFAPSPEKLEQNIMCRLINVDALVQQMYTVWEARLQNAQWHGKVTVNTGMGQFCLTRQGQQLSISNEVVTESQATFTQSEFLHLLLGNADAANTGICTNEAARNLIMALFPPLAHTFWRADGF